ncbi:MAG: BACON domain-containing carbohydrate-binding protein [Bryobacteraceae bacterium]
MHSKKAVILIAAKLAMGVAFGQIPQGTAGCVLSPNVPSTLPSSSNVVGITWQTEIDQYTYQPAAGFPVRIRYDADCVFFTGSAGGTCVGASIQNVGHAFADDAVGASNPFPALGLYLTSLDPSLLNSQHGVSLDADPTAYPQFGRIFENVDGGGFVGMNIYTRQNVGSPDPLHPILVRWTVSRVGVVTNPLGNFSKDLTGAWAPLVGTFVQWRFSIAISGQSQDVATYYLPIEKAEYISVGTPLDLGQEQFGSVEDTLVGEPTRVHYSDMRVTDGAAWYPLQQWRLFHCIDNLFNGYPITDLRYGWESDADSLVSTAGHDDDIAGAIRTIGATFTIQSGIVCAVSTNPASVQVSAAAQTFPMSIADPTGCFWEVVDSDGWVSSQPSSGLNDSQTQLSFRANPYPFLRNTTVQAGNQSVSVQQGAWLTGTTHPVASYPDDILWPGVEAGTYVDTRILALAAGQQAFAAMPYVGQTQVTNGSIQSPGPAFQAAGGTPFVMLDTTRDVVLMHPCPGNCSAAQGAVAEYTVPYPFTYRITGAFARANDATGAGLGVNVLVFKNNNLQQPLYSADIGPMNTVNPTDYFGGAGSAAFDLTAFLQLGDTVNIGVFAMPGDGTFDATAVKFRIVPDAGVTCTYKLAPASAAVSASGGTGAITLTTAPGCGWLATSDAPWITLNTGASGGTTGTIGYSVLANTGADRTATINVAGQQATVSQDAPNVTFTASPISAAGVSTLSWNAPGYSSVVIHVNSATGPAMTGILSSSGSAPTGTWVTNGMQFFLVDAASGTGIANVAVGGSGLSFTASPISAAGVSTLSWNAPGYSSLVIHVNSATGPAMTGILSSSGSAPTGTWVANGMQFFLVDAASGTTIADVTVAV